MFLCEQILINPSNLGTIAPLVGKKFAHFFRVFYFLNISRNNHEIFIKLITVTGYTTKNKL
jgi:hypothetical protein